MQARVVDARVACLPCLSVHLTPRLSLNCGRLLYASVSVMPAGDVVMNLTMSDSFVTNLWFGEEEDRWEKLMYLGVALVMVSAGGWRS